MLVDFTVLSKVAVRAVAQVVRLAIDANAAVEARVGETFISVDAALAVQCHHLGLAATFCLFFGPKVLIVFFVLFLFLTVYH